MKDLAGSGNTFKNLHHIGVTFHHQSPAALCVEKYDPLIIFNESVGTTESQYERNIAGNILKHLPRTFNAQSATPFGLFR